MTLGYDRFGHGARKVLALHGWFSDESFMAPMREALSPEDFTYIFPALRGYGASKAKPGAYDLQEISADIRALMDELGFERASLVGHAMGAKFIQRVAVDIPERIERLVAIAPVPAAAVAFDAGAWDLYSGATESLDTRRAILASLAGSRIAAAALDRLAQASWDNCTHEAFAGYLLAWAKTGFAEQVQGCEIPLKAILGQHDGAIDAETARAKVLVLFRNAELEVIPDAGHFPMIEAPAALAASMQAFLRG